MAGFNGVMTRPAWMLEAETVAVMTALLQGGGDARFVGGCVRDALCNRKVTDIDIATPLRPEAVMDRLAAAKINCVPTGIKHGTVTAIAGGKPFEITTLRVDTHSHGRHADVVFTDDWRKDAARRDFTINAMSASIDGEVYDPFGGIADLRDGRVVFVGDPEARIAEDYLRILRFFRFFAHYGRGAPDAAAIAACTHHVKKIALLSAERIRHEILRLLEAPQAAEVWIHMRDARVVTEVLPEATDIAALKNLSALEARYHAAGSVMRRLAALLVVTLEGLRHTVKSLRLSNAQADALQTLLFPPQDVAQVTTEQAVRRLVYKTGNDAARSLLLLCAAKNGAVENFSALHDEATKFRAPSFPLRGQDAAAQGFTGAGIGAALQQVEDWWIAEDFIPGRTACLEKLKSAKTD
jgi:poly(A) polymerase